MTWDFASFRQVARPRRPVRQVRRRRFNISLRKAAARLRKTAQISLRKAARLRKTAYISLRKAAARLRKTAQISLRKVAARLRKAAQILLRKVAAKPRKTAQILLRKAAAALRSTAQNASAKLAKFAALKNMNKSPQEAFKAAWKSLLSNPLYGFLVRVGHHPSFARPELIEPLLKAKTFELLSQEIQGFYRSTSIVVPADLKLAIESQKPLVIVQIHEPHSFVSRILADYGREYTRIVADPPRYAQRMQAQGIDTSRAHLVKKGPLSLGHLLKSVRRNHVICSVLDDMPGIGGYINPAIFQFANRAGIPVFFVKTHVDERGTAALLSSGPHNDVDPLQLANEFLKFFNSVGDLRVTMKIKTSAIEKTKARQL